MSTGSANQHSMTFLHPACSGSLFGDSTEKGYGLLRQDLSRIKTPESKMTNRENSFTCTKAPELMELSSY